MNLFSSNLEKAKAALADSTSAHALAVAALDAHCLGPADPGDAGAQKQWFAIKRDLIEDVRIAEGVVVHWTSVVDKLEAEAAEKVRAAEKLAVEKEAQAFRGLVNEIASDSAKVKAKIEKLEAHRERAVAAGVRDAEWLVRSRPGRIRPAILDEPKTVWFGPDGKRYATNQTYDESGCVVEAKDRVARVVVDVLYEERQDPPVMPERFSTAIRLVDIEGRPL